MLQEIRLLGGGGGGGGGGVSTVNHLSIAGTIR